MSETNSVSVKISTSSRLWAHDIGLVAKYTTDTLPGQQGKLEVWEDEHGSFDLRQPDPNRQPTIEHDGHTFVRFNSYHMQFLSSTDSDENLRTLAGGQDRISVVAVARVSDERIPTEFQGGPADRHPTKVGTFLHTGSTQFNLFRNTRDDDIEIELKTKRASARWSTGLTLENRWRTFVFNADSKLPRVLVGENALTPDQQRGTDLQDRDAGPLRVGFWKRDRALLDLDVTAILIFRHGPPLLDLQSKGDGLLQKIYPVVNIQTQSSLSVDTVKTVQAEVDMQTSSTLEAQARVDLNDLDDLAIWYSALDERLKANPIATWHDLSSNDQNLQMSPHRDLQPVYEDCPTNKLVPSVRFPDSVIGTLPLQKPLDEYTIFLGAKTGYDARQLPMYITSAMQVWLRKQRGSSKHDLVVVANPGLLAQRSVLFEEVLEQNEVYDLFIQGDGGDNISVILNGQTLTPDETNAVWNEGFPLQPLDEEESPKPLAQNWSPSLDRPPILSNGCIITEDSDDTADSDVRTFAIQKPGLLVLGEADRSEYTQFALFRRFLEPDEKAFIRDYLERHHK